MIASVSRVKLFKSCRRAYFFKYKENLVPIKDADFLVTGKRYHEYIESMYAGDEAHDTSKAAAMAMAYRKYILPKINVIKAEKWLEKSIGKHTLIGRVDGLTENDDIVEHKTTSSDISEGGEYEYSLMWDDQILAYMSLTGKRRIIYTVCKKPTIRMKKDESEDEFFNRMVAWYDDDTENKIRMFEVYRTDDEVAEFEREFEQVCDEMQRAEDQNILYKCQSHCNMWGRRCEYSGICLNYDPSQEYVEYERREREYGVKENQ